MRLIKLHSAAAQRTRRYLRARGKSLGPRSLQKQSALSMGLWAECDTHGSKVPVEASAVAAGCSVWHAGVPTGPGATSAADPSRRSSMDRSTALHSVLGMWLNKSPCAHLTPPCQKSCINQAHIVGACSGLLSRPAEAESSMMTCGSTAAASAIVRAAKPKRCVHMRRREGSEGSTRCPTFSLRSTACSACIRNKLW